MFSSHLFGASSVAPCFFAYAFFAEICICNAAEDVEVKLINGASFQSTHDAVVEVVETEGLVASAVIPFGAMLSRTAEELGQKSSPYGKAEIIQFCSSALAWEMILEDSDQLALCPLSIAIYSKIENPETVVLAYRSPGRATPGRARGDDLLQRLVQRAAKLARLAW